MKADSFPLVCIQKGLFNNIAYITNIVSIYSQLMIVTDSNVAPLYLNSLLKIFKNIHNLKQIDSIIIPAGDESKTLRNAEIIFNSLIEKHHTRNTVLIALGGGMIGDLTGFCAACYLRGVDYIQIPTTLLAQVDAAIGGKTGVNHALGKNLIGAFYQPKAVITDINVLNSLPDREFKSALAEVLKYGLIYDPDFFYWVEKNIELILNREASILEIMIRRSADIKNNIILKDEKEKNGLRVFLNLGHTLGHAIEAALNYKTILHGEAVSIGLISALYLSQKLYNLNNNILINLKKILSQIGLPTQIPNNLEINVLMQAMQHDKKNTQNTHQWVLLEALGAPRLRQVSSELLYQVLSQLGAKAEEPSLAL